MKTGRFKPAIPDKNPLVQNLTFEIKYWHLSKRDRKTCQWLDSLKALFSPADAKLLVGCSSSIF